MSPTAGFLCEIWPSKTSTVCARVELLMAVESPERLKKIRDEAVEISVGFAKLINLLDRVDHRRMVLSPKTATELGQRRVRDVFAHVHRTLSRQRNRLREVLGFERGESERVILGDELLNRFERDR